MLLHRVILKFTFELHNISSTSSVYLGLISRTVISHNGGHKGDITMGAKAWGKYPRVVGSCHYNFQPILISTAGALRIGEVCPLPLDPLSLHPLPLDLFPLDPLPLNPLPLYPLPLH